MPMDFKKMTEAQGANKLIRQWNSIKLAATPPGRIMIQAQAAGSWAAASNIAVESTDPEFEQMWTLVKAVVDRKYLEQAVVLAEAEVDSTDVHPTVKAEAAAAVAAKVVTP